MAVRISAPTACLLSLFFASSCGTPTTPSSPRSAAGPGGSHEVLKVGPSSSQSLEEFHCGLLEDVHVRFSSPGYVEGNRVGLYAKYDGVPPGEKLLRLWWDFENDQMHFQDVRLGQGEERREDSTLFDIEIVVEHVYDPVSFSVTRMVRAELIVLGLSGNCARNRLVTLGPSEPTEEGSGGAQSPCAVSRFCRLENGSVRDNLTGLVWLEDSSCRGPRRWQRAKELAAELGHGECGLTDGSAPGEWRLPTQMELETLLDPRYQNPSLSNARGNAQWTPGDAFVGVENRFYWSSDFVENCLGPLPGAMMVHLGNGSARCRLISIGFGLFWPVRAP